MKRYIFSFPPTLTSKILCWLTITVIIKKLANSNQHKPVIMLWLTGIILTYFYQMIDLCSAVVLSCMNLNVAFPPENPVKCKNSTMYCCKTDFCNSDVIIQEKLSKVLHASVMGKLFCALAGVSCIYFDDADFEFV